MTNIILCGGSGTRLWPISRTLMPKQFVKLFGGKSLFQMTLERNAKACSRQFIVSNSEQYFLALDQLEELDTRSTLDTGDSTFLLEPVGRNTAPAIALACLNIDPEEIVLVTPSDHLIKNETAYLDAIASAKDAAKNECLVTFGIEPSYPETGFGYIEAKRQTGMKQEAEAGKLLVLDVRKFHEKPDAETAQKYLAAGNYYWNSGMFCFKAGLFLEELKKHAPDIYETSLMAHEKREEIARGQLRIRHADMIAIPDESIDYAVMEKSEKVKVIPCDIGWSDLGSFDALYEELPKDENGNTQNDSHISIGSKNNLIIGSDRTIATVDIEDLMIVDTGDALLVSKKGSSQKVKEVVKKLKESGSQLPTVHLTAHRPWGTYTVLEDTAGYKIKRIVVKPGKRLSLQKHFHRSEHWIVVSGTATVTVGDETKLVRPNESTYIKIGEIHRLANDGKIPVVLIEAQVGEYTGEDDIVRLNDDFKRD